MKNKTVATTVYAILPVLICAALLLLSAAPIMTVPVLLIGGLVLPPLSFGCMRRLGMRYVPLWLLVVAGLCFFAAPVHTVGLLFFAVWFASAAILYYFVNITPDLFPILMIGGALYLAVLALCGAMLVRLHFGVWDFRGVYTGIENIILTAFATVGNFYKSLPAQTPGLQQVLSQFTQIVEQIKQHIDIYVFQIILTVITAFCVQYFWTLKAGQFVCRKTAPIELVSVRLFTIPREVAVAYVLISAISIFSIGGDYQYAVELANDLMGYLFALCGIGLIDLFMSRKMSDVPRMIIKIVLAAAVVISNCFLSGLVYTILLCAGIFVSFSRRLIILKRDDKEDPHE